MGGYCNSMVFEGILLSSSRGLGTISTMCPHVGKVMGMGTHRGLWVWVQVGMGVGTGFGYPYPYPYPHGGYSGANSPF